MKVKRSKTVREGTETGLKEGRLWRTKYTVPSIIMMLRTTDMVAFAAFDANTAFNILLFGEKGVILPRYYEGYRHQVYCITL